MLHTLLRFRPATLRVVLRKAVTVLALVGYLTATIGCPVPRGGSPDGAYPCAGRGCGCGSAEECWRGCCCSTLAERLAWAASHGITPPSYVGQKLEQPQAAVADRKPQPREACCGGGQMSLPGSECSDQSVAGGRCETSKSCCAKQPPAAQKSETRGGTCFASQSTKQQSRGRHATKSPRFGWLIGMQWLKCRGIGSHWLSLGDPVAPPPAAVEWQRDERVVGTVAERFTFFRSPVYAPATRPG